MMGMKPVVRSSKTCSTARKVMSVDEATAHEPHVARSVQPKSSLVAAWCSSALGGAAARRRKQRSVWAGAS